MITITVLDGKQVVTTTDGDEQFDEIEYVTPTWNNQSGDGSLSRLWLIDPDGQIFTGVASITDAGRTCVPVSVIRNGKNSGSTYELNAIDFDDMFVSVSGSWEDFFSIEDCYNHFVEMAENHVVDKDSFIAAMRRYWPEQYNNINSLGEVISMLAEDYEMEEYTVKRIILKVPYAPVYDENGQLTNEIPEDTYPEAEVLINDESYKLTVMVDEDFGDNYIEGLPDEAETVQLVQTGVEYNHGVFEAIIMYSPAPIH